MAGVAGRSGGVRVAGEGKRIGRPKSGDAKEFTPAGLRPDRRSWLRLWARSPDVDNFTEQLDELLDRAMKFWPDGPAAGPPVSVGPRRPRPAKIADGDLLDRLDLVRGSLSRDAVLRRALVAYLDSQEVA